MPDAHIGTIHFDRLLTNLAVVYRNDEFIYDRVIPKLPVKNETDKFLIYGKDNMRLDDDLWADGTVAKEVQYTTTEGTYSVRRHGLKSFVSDKKVKQSDSPLRPLVSAQNLLLDKIKLRQEKKAATLLRTTANNGAETTLSGNDQWSDLANSDPIDDVVTAITTIHGKTAKRPNIIVIPFQVMMVLKQHPDILDRIKYSQKGVVTADLIAQVFEIPTVLVPGGLENTAKEGQTDVLAYLWGKDVWIGYQEPRPSLQCLTHSMNFMTQDMKTERWRENERKGQMIRVSKEDDPNVVAKDCSYRIISAVA
jgi:hypothetical protein